MAFFIGWELWQDMTFILACLIAIVFAVAFFKLWRTTQILRRYELLDEEKRERIAEMQRSGIAIPPINDIPFGSRAIQSGIEVDEIWISRSNTPATSKPASCATILIDGSADCTPQGRKISTSSHTQSTVRDKQGIESGKVLRHSALSEQHLGDSTTLDERETANSVTSSILKGRDNSPKMTKIQPHSYGGGVPTTSVAALAVASPVSADSANPRSEPVDYATTEVFAKTTARSTVAGFQILPAGSLGERFELPGPVRPSDGVQPCLSNEAPPERRLNRLQKSRPRKPR